MTIPNAFLDDLKARVGLTDVVGRKVKLARRGREFVGLCPFHNEKTPSFTVIPDKGFYHCFGCGAHGSAIDFVMETEGLGFRDAVERLAAEAGLVVPADSPEERERAKRRETLTDVVEAAARHFEQQLRMPEGRDALDYLRRRGLDEATIARFRLGYAPDARQGLKTALARDGVPDDLVVEAGLVIRPEDDGRAPYDRFRGRVMFPIRDRRGRVVAFGGRALGDGEPKYLNSPETPLFHKGRMLYGLDLAAKPARDAGTVIVAEGYMDVIALHRAGFENAVAPLGTALTEDQIGELWRLAPEPVLCFDGDAAGARAAARAAERALPHLRPGFGLRFALMPAGEDPDSLLARGGRPAIAQALDAAQPMSEVLWRMETGGRPGRAPEDRARLEARLRAHAGRIADATVRGHFLSAFRDRLWREFRGGRGTDRRGAAAAPAPVPGAAPTSRLDVDRLHESILVAVLVTHPEAVDAIGERLGSIAFSAPDLDRLRQQVLKTLAGAAGLDSAALHCQLIECGFSEVLGSVLSPRVFDHAFFAKPHVGLEQALDGWEEVYARYTQRFLDTEIADEKERLSEAMSAPGFDRFRALKHQRYAEK